MGGPLVLECWQRHWQPKWHKPGPAQGGVAEIFDLVAEELPNLSDASPLTASYRSSTAVVEFVNMAFENLDRYTSKDPIVDQPFRKPNQRVGMIVDSLE